jgi:phytanoyl-CoA hydroxylase
MGLVEPFLRWSSLYSDNPSSYSSLTDTFNSFGCVKSNLSLDSKTLRSLTQTVDSFLLTASPGRIGNQIISRFGSEEFEQGWKINNLWETCPDFLALAAHPTILGEIARISNAGAIRLWRDQLLAKQAGTPSDVKWHQDAYWWSVLSPASQITAWVALDAVSVQNGCLRMVLGSHKWGLQTEIIDAINSGHAQLKRDHTIDINLHAGDIHYHHCLTWHASHTNRSTSVRRGYAIHYMVDNTYFASNRTHPIADAITVDRCGRVSGVKFPLLWCRDALQP